LGDGSSSLRVLFTARDFGYRRAGSSEEAPMNRRKEIELSPEEQSAYLAQARTITLCTHGPDGYPHAVAMWFDADEDGTVWMTTYRKSQKTVNIRRNPKVALSVESGTTYDTLKGVLIRGEAEIIDEPEMVLQTFKRVHGKMLGGSLPEGIGEQMRSQAAKRIVIKVRPRKLSSWDHSKLGGTY
jgi:PPOX class probable F420-dependent enzyme